MNIAQVVTIEDLLDKGFVFKNGGLVFSYQNDETGCNIIFCQPRVHWNLNIHTQEKIEYYYDRTKEMLSVPLSQELTEKLHLLEQKYNRYCVLNDESMWQLLDIQSRLIEIIGTHEANNKK